MEWNERVNMRVQMAHMRAPSSLIFVPAQPMTCTAQKWQALGEAGVVGRTEAESRRDETRRVGRVPG